MSHIFISYSHQDSDYAHKLAAALEQHGFEGWIDDRIDYGSQWPHEIQENLDCCGVFIVIMTPRSYNSDWVQNELARAKRKGKPVFALLLEGDEPWLAVEATQYMDVRGGKLPDTGFYASISRKYQSSGVSQNAAAPLSSPEGTNYKEHYHLETTGIRIFGKDKDDEEKYVKWVTDNPNGFVFNAERRSNNTPYPYKLHRADCRTIRDSKRPEPNWTKDYMKICSVDRQELVDWGNRQLSKFPKSTPFDCCPLCDSDPKRSLNR